jgi:hypothetical protein
MSEEIKGKARGGVARAKSLTPEERSIIAKKAATARWSIPKKSNDVTGLQSIDETEDSNRIAFNNNGSEIYFRFDSSEQAIWATQKQIAELFNVGIPAISKHISNIILDGELEADSVVSKMETTATDGKRYLTDHYSLDMILSIGYRVNSKKATEFRKWSTQTLKAYIEQGYVLNEKALRESPEKLNKLAAQIRALRSEEKQIYAKVRECFKISSSDYDPSSKQVKKFYALLQDKFHHAVTGMTSSKLMLDRADHMEENMGLQTMKGDFPTLEDAKTGKNFLKPNELYRLHILSEQFLLFAESTALSGKNMTMESLHNQLDRLLSLNDYPVFSGYQDYLKDKALQHVKSELTLLKKRVKIESLGYEYDEEKLADGEYDDILISA